MRAVKAFLERLVERALAMDGPAPASTASARARSSTSKAEHGAGWSSMRAVKSALDPLGILNPGKIVPAA